MCPSSMGAMLLRNVSKEADSLCELCWEGSSAEKGEGGGWRYVLSQTQWPPLLVLVSESRLERSSVLGVGV